MKIAGKFTCPLEVRGSRAVFLELTAITVLHRTVELNMGRYVPEALSSYSAQKKGNKHIVAPDNLYLHCYQALVRNAVSPKLQASMYGKYKDSTEESPNTFDPTKTG